MSSIAASDHVVRVHNLRDYFRESIDAAIDKQGVDVDPNSGVDWMRPSNITSGPSISSQI